MLKLNTGRLLAFGSLLSLAGFLQACNSQENQEKEQESRETKEFTYTVEPAPEWTEVFQRESGWFGGDGIFAIPYSGQDSGTAKDSILFLFSDTMFGEIVDGKLQPGYTMVNNSVATFVKGSTPASTSFHVAKDAQGKPATTFIPETDGEEYYWLGDGFVNNQKNGDLYVFAYRIRNVDNGSLFPFEEVGNDLLVIEDRNRFPLQVTRSLEIPISEGTGKDDRISFGAGIYTEGDTVYIYGVRGANKELVVARTKAVNIEDFSSWEFRTADGWSSSRTEMQPVSKNVSNELSVSKLSNGQYALIYQEGGIYPKINMQLSDTPYGPFGELKAIWDTSSEVNDPDLFTYNAKAHPAISPEGELLVSYNVNSFKFFEVIESKPQLYRPRFIRIKFNSPE